jgi:micrococcal nuclease
MKRKKGWFIRFLFLCISLILSIILTSGQSEEISSVPDLLLDLEQVRINFIYDGDTVRTDTGVKIRLLGVDAPEMNWEEREPNFFAREAFEYTKENLLGQLVYLEYDEVKEDKYGRTLAYLFLADGTFFNQKLLEEGYARLLLIPPNLKYSDVLREAEERARAAGRGIWSAVVEEIFEYVQ